MRPGTTWTVAARRVIPLLVASVCACGGDGTTDILDDLTEAEAGQLLTALSAVYLPSPSAPTPSPSRLAPALAPTTTLITDTTQVSVACPAGGTAAVLNGDSISITVDVRLNPSPDTTFVSASTWGGRSRAEVQYLSCSATDGMGGTWTFDAEPGLVLDFELDGTLQAVGLANGSSSSSSTTSWNGLWSGTLGWSNGSRSGSCAISVEMSSASVVGGGQASSTFSQNGQVCGLVVSNSS